MSKEKQINTPTCTNSHQPCTNLTPTCTNSAVGESEQIEEMAKVYDNARLKARETLGSMNEGEDMWYSKAFYNAGYRKQSEGEWKPIIKCKTSTKTLIYYQCSLCGVYLASEANYCPNCGAHMKGGAE